VCSVLACPNLFVQKAPLARVELPESVNGYSFTRETEVSLRLTEVKATIAHDLNAQSALREKMEAQRQKREIEQLKFFQAERKRQEEERARQQEESRLARIAAEEAEKKRTEIEALAKAAKEEAERLEQVERYEFFQQQREREAREQKRLRKEAADALVRQQRDAEVLHSSTNTTGATPTPTTVEAKTTYVCSACTMENSINNLECYVCGTKNTNHPSLTQSSSSSFSTFRKPNPSISSSSSWHSTLSTQQQQLQQGLPALSRPNSVRITGNQNSNTRVTIHCPEGVVLEHFFSTDQTLWSILTWTGYTLRVDKHMKLYDDKMNVYRDQDMDKQLATLGLLGAATVTVKF
jgi:hypothetical protein